MHDLNPNTVPLSCQSVFSEDTWLLNLARSNTLKPNEEFEDELALRFKLLYYPNFRLEKFLLFLDQANGFYDENCFEKESIVKKLDIVKSKTRIESILFSFILLLI